MLKKSVGTCSTMDQNFIRYGWISVGFITILSILGMSIAAGQQDISGLWYQSAPSVGDSEWQITCNQSTNKWDATEGGLGAATGTATLTGNVLRIDWTTTNGWAGYYQWTLDPSLTSGSGILQFQKKYNSPNSDSTTSTVTRKSTSSSQGCDGLQVNGQGLHPTDPRIFIVAGYNYGPTKDVRIFITNPPVGASPSTLASMGSLYSIDTMPVLPPGTKRVDYRVEYWKPCSAGWISCGYDYTWQESYR